EKSPERFPISIIGCFQVRADELGHLRSHETSPAQMVGIVPPSITYSLPVIDEARSDARKATNSATSSGRFGRPSGIPPSESMMRCLAASLLIPVRSAISFTMPTAASVSVYPGDTEFTRMPFEATSLERHLL